MSYTLDIHCRGEFSVRSFVRPSISLSVGPSIGPIVGPSAGWMHSCLSVRLVLKENGREKQHITYDMDLIVTITVVFFNETNQ